MHMYEIVLEASSRHPAERVELQADCPAAVFSWGERSAHGRRFELFEDGRSLGSASLALDANFWILSPVKRVPISNLPSPPHPSVGP